MKRFLGSHKVQGWAIASVLGLLLIVSSWSAIVTIAQPIFSNFLFLQGANSGSSPSLVSTGSDTNIDLTLTPKGTGKVVIQGGLPTFPNVPTQFFINAVDACYSDNANLVKVRNAAGNWVLARTAGGAETYNIECSAGFPTQTQANKGVRVTSFLVSQSITVVNLTSATFQGLFATTYANNVATAVNAYGGAVTITLPTATQANPYLTTGTPGTPAFMNTANTQIVIDFQVVMANTGVYQLAGILVNFDDAY